MMLKKSVIVTAIILFCAGVPAQAQQQTKLVVRAKAKDAKFIGDGMGGAMITVLEAATGDTLARGLTKGGTGDTERLVKDPVTRYETLSTPGAAAFETTLSLDKPTLVTIEATAPWGTPHARITGSVQQWVIPGRDITGDGIIVEIPGFTITNRRPAEGVSYTAGERVPIRSHIVMMCGCPTADGGLWDSSEYAIEARIAKGGEHLKTVPLSFSGETSLFEGSFTPARPGRYTITVTAFHPATDNAGVAKTEITVE